MKEQIQTCRFNKPRIDMVSPHVSGTVDYCTFRRIQPTPVICKHCEWYEPNLIKKLKDLFKK
jgi:hypothetical protein